MVVWVCKGVLTSQPEPVDDRAEGKQKIKLLKSTVERELLLIKELHEISGIFDSLFSSTIQKSSVDVANTAASLQAQESRTDALNKSLSDSCSEPMESVAS